MDILKNPFEYQNSYPKELENVHLDPKLNFKSKRKRPYKRTEYWNSMPNRCVEVIILWKKSKLKNQTKANLTLLVLWELCMFFFSAVLDTNGKMTTFFVLPILQKLKREGFFYHKEFLKESSSVRNSLRNHHTFLGKKTLGNVVSSSSQVLRKLQKMHFTNSTENGWKKKTYTITVVEGRNDNHLSSESTPKYC